MAIKNSIAILKDGQSDMYGFIITIVSEVVRTDHQISHHHSVKFKIIIIIIIIISAKKMCGGTMKMDIIMNWMMILTLKPTTNATQLRLRSINRRKE